MPKPMLKALPKTNTSLSIYEKQKEELITVVSEKTERLLRKTRSKEYMKALQELDAGGHTQNQKKVEEIISIIQKEFPDVDIFKILLGTIAICYLGKPYEVHILDLAGYIIEHYKIGETLPKGMEKARGIVLRGGYDFLEVYTDCCRAVRKDGSVSVIPF